MKIRGLAPTLENQMELKEKGLMNLKLGFYEVI